MLAGGAAAREVKQKSGGNRMRHVEVRRHAMRAQPGEHLSQAGVSLARRVGESMGPFDLVVTSALPRAYETAIAMGFAVDAQYRELNTSPAEVEVGWTGGFPFFVRAAAAGGAAAAFARGLADLLRDISGPLPDGGRALVVTHGGFVEAATVACLPSQDLSDWGGPCDYCEGVELTFDGEQFTAVKLLPVRSQAQ